MNVAKPMRRQVRIDLLSRMADLFDVSIDVGMMKFVEHFAGPTILEP